MLTELHDFASRILNANDFEVIDHDREFIHVIFTADQMEFSLARRESGSETVYDFYYSNEEGELTIHRIGYYRDYEEYEVANDLADAFLFA